ncbi:MAG: hypothetical protein RL199_2458 [Pseudomonadota bacterium]|jgi:hypothetical protein
MKSGWMAALLLWSFAARAETTLDIPGWLSRPGVKAVIEAQAPLSPGRDAERTDRWMRACPERRRRGKLARRASGVRTPRATRG